MKLVFKKIFKKHVWLILIIGLSLLLRFYRLGENPVGLYWDEAAIGVDSFYLGKTLKDQAGRSWLQAFYPSYGDYKAPLYIILTGLSVKLFGLNEFSIRFVSAFFGVLTVILTYLITKKIFNKDKKEVIALVTSFLVAVSPWSGHFSRVGFESNLSLFWLVSSLWLFLKGLDKGVFLILSSLAGLASVYSYFSTRVVLPLIVLLASLFFIKKLWLKKEYFLLSIVIFILGLIPIIKSPFYQASQIVRLSTDSILNNQELIINSSQLVEKDDLSLIGRVFHHRYYYFSKDFLNNYLQHFSFDFLFLRGDFNLRHHSGYGGELYFALLPFLFLGLYYFIQEFDQGKGFILAWLLVSPVTASIPYEVPHASRSIYMVIPLLMIISLGMARLWQRLKTEKLLFVRIGLGLILLLNISLYFHDYFSHYPSRSCQDWQDGYRQLMVYLKDKQSQYDQIYVTQQYRLPHLYYLFYIGLENKDFQQLENKTEDSPTLVLDSGRVDNVWFGLRDDQELDVNKRILIVSTPGDQTRRGFERIKQISFTNDKPAFIIYTNVE